MRDSRDARWGQRVTAIFACLAPGLRVGNCGAGRAVAFAALMIGCASLAQAETQAESKGGATVSGLVGAGADKPARSAGAAVSTAGEPQAAASANIEAAEKGAAAPETLADASWPKGRLLQKAAALEAAPKSAAGHDGEAAPTDSGAKRGSAAEPAAGKSTSPSDKKALANKSAASPIDPKKAEKDAAAIRALAKKLKRSAGPELARLVEKLALMAAKIGPPRNAALKYPKRRTKKAAVKKHIPPPPIAKGPLTPLRKKAGKKLVKTKVDGFSFYLPGDLIPGTSPTNGDVGARDDRFHRPNIRFPIEKGPAYVNSQVWGWGGTFGLGSSECDLRNYSYPWRDNFCESRSWVSGVCPGGIGHQGVDIRAKTCDDDKYWAVAAEAGMITEVGVYGITLRGDSGYEYTYLHINTPKAKVRPWQRVKRGQKIALISNHYGGTPTSIHLHFEMRRPSKKKGGEPVLVSPYASLIPAYLRLMTGSEKKADEALKTATVIPRPKQPPRFRGFSGNGPRGWGGGLRDCSACPLMKRVPGGATKIGSPNNESGRDRNEGPRRTANVRSFVMSRNEVTRHSWRACVKDGYCRPADKSLTWKSPKHPITGITLLDVVGGGAKKGFIAWLNNKAKRRGRKVRYRLPSEAEWEHALRAGSDAPYVTGQTPDPTRIAFNAVAYKKFPAKVRQRKSPVTRRSLRANRWGFYEMAGNVWELTADCWAKTHRFTPRDGSARGSGGCGLGTIKGGSVFSPGSEVRSAARKPISATTARRDVGFRVVREPIGGAKRASKKKVGAKNTKKRVKKAATASKKSASRPKSTSAPKKGASAPARRRSRESFDGG